MNPFMKNLSYHFIFFIAILSSSCKEFIEPPITDKTIQVNAPANNYQSTSFSVNFWWDKVDDALTYRLQIVTPGFANAGALITDTLIKGDKITLNLNPGDYQWRLRAENGATQTAYSTPQNFTVLFSTIKEQKVQLSLPGNNYSTNQGNLSFTWASLYGATKYRLQIDTNNFADETKLVYNQVTPALQVNFALSKDQFYQWRVRAENDTDQAQWSAVNLFTYDHTPPAAVSLTTPLNNQLATSPVALQWNQPATSVKYKLYMFREDGTTPYNTTFPMLLTTNTYSLTQGIYGERIYWKVTATDAMGNEGAASELRSFVVQ
jgi:uncharacterized protein YegP (UPF0339 family)